VVPAATPPDAAEATPAPAPKPTVILPDLPTRSTITEEEKDRAEKAFNRAAQAYSDNDLDGALFAADAAFKYLPGANTALLRAIILGDKDRHREAFETYLTAHDLGPTAKERQRIEAGLAKHGKAANLGWVVIAARPTDARVKLHGRSVPAGRTIGLSVGEHRVTVSADKHVDISAAFTIRAGIGQRLQYELPKKPEKPPEPKPEPEPGPRVLPWALIGSGVALVIAGGGLNAWALSAAEDTARYGVQMPTLSETERRSRYDAAASDAEVGRALAGTLYALGTAAAIAGAVLFFVDDDEESTVKATPAVVGVDGAGAALWGRF